jgi:DNA invertase Pin-like site-specific DNA recombinase
VNVVSYLRVSGKGQVDGDGFERQGQAIRAFCKASGLRIQGDFLEEGVTGTMEGIERPAFSRLLATRGSTNFDAIVVERMDRLARDLMVSEMLLRECRENGIKVFSADQGNLTDMASDGGDPTRVLIRQIMGALAQWEKSVLVKKLKASRDRVRASGKRCEGVKPYGYFPGEAFILEQMQQRRAELIDGVPTSYQRIACQLNEAGCVTRSKKAWTAQLVRDILVNHKPKKEQS